MTKNQTTSKTNTQKGSEALASHKEAVLKQDAGLKFHFQEKNRTKVQTPKYSHLPHIDLAGHYQFVTFRTFDSIDDFVRKLDFSPATTNKQKQLIIDEYLDGSCNGAYLKDDVLRYLFDFLVNSNKKLYELVAFAIMNNHVHILFKPNMSLSKTMQMIKGASAKAINEILGKRGKFWANDYYDTVIRDEKHFLVAYEYIKNNPLKIGDTKVSLPNISGTKVQFPRFYGIFEEVE